MSRRTVNPLTKPQIRAMMNEVQSQGMTSLQQRMEKAFLLSMVNLINEIQGSYKLTSQAHSYRKSTWIKQTKNPRIKVDALARV